MNDEYTNGPIEENSTDKTEQRKEQAKAPWLTMPLAVVIAGVVIAGGIVLSRTPVTSDAAAAADTAGAPITADMLRPASATDHIIGSPDAPVVLVEFADFQCPYCSVIYPTLKRIVEESNGEVAWVFRNLPLESIHPEARPAAEAAERINGLKGNEAHWQFMEDIWQA